MQSAVDSSYSKLSAVRNPRATSRAEGPWGVYISSVRRSEANTLPNTLSEGSSEEVVCSSVVVGSTVVSGTGSGAHSEALGTSMVLE